ncbi:MAG: hypothetical protein WD276_06020 [Actinomycetota bacterium]
MAPTPLQESISRHKVLILVSVATALAVGFLVSPRTTEYTSTAKVKVNQAWIREEATMAEQRAVASGPEVADIARRDLGTDSSIESIRASVEIDVLPGQVLALRFSNPVPPVAQSGAQAFADAYLERRGEIATEEVRSHTKPLESELQKLEKMITHANEKLQQIHPGPDAIGRITRIQQELGETQRRMGALQQRLLPLRSSDLSGGKMIEQAGKPVAGTSRPVLVRDLAIAALIGLVIGIALASARDRMGGNPGAVRAPSRV